MTSTAVDIIVVIVLILSTLLAWSRGFTRESLSIAGWIIAVLVARQYAGLGAPLIDSVPGVSKYIQGCELRTAVGFVIVFVAAMIVMALITPLFAGMVQNSFFAAFDSGLGALFGFARGLLIVFLVMLVYAKFVQPSSKIAMLEESRSYSILGPTTSEIEKQVEGEDGLPAWLTGQFDYITRSCPAVSVQQNG